MATDVVMPQMGESITEGTIVRWMKKVGDQDRSRRAAAGDHDRQGGRRGSIAAAGIVAEILAKEGETVSVNTCWP